MPRRGQHDQSPGDARQPFSDRGGPAGKHAETHDVDAEERSNAKGPDTEVEDFEADLVNDPTSGQPGTGHADDSHNATGDKELHTLLGLDSDDLDRIPVLEPGTKLKQGGTYVDLNDPERQPFKAMGGHEAGPRDRFVSKRDTDHEIWNELVGQGREAEVERPEGVEEA